MNIFFLFCDPNVLPNVSVPTIDAVTEQILIPPFKILGKEILERD